MIVEIKIPSPGESITEVELARWFVKEGDYVKKDAEIAEIESDKATLQILASENGTIHLLVKEGETVKPGILACTIDTSGIAGKRAEVLVSPAKKPIAPEVVSSTMMAEPVTKVEPFNGIEAKVTPLAQAMMDENGMTANDVVAALSRINSNHVRLALEQMDNEKVHSEHKSMPVSRIENRSRMTQLRKRLSQRLVAVKNETAMLTTFNEVDMSRVMEVRKGLQEGFVAKYGVKLGFMSFFTRAVALAVKDHPMVNSRIDGDEIVSPDFVDVGIAVSAPKGLMVPVIRNCETKSLGQIESELAALAVKARDGKLSIEEMTGGTFTITNGGVFGSLLSTPIINPPQSAILGMHNIVDRPVAVNGQVVIRPMMYIALSYDHRIIDGKDSVGFLVKVKQFLESPERLLVDY